MVTHPPVKISAWLATLDKRQLAKSPHELWEFFSATVRPCKYEDFIEVCAQCGLESVNVIPMETPQDLPFIVRRKVMMG
jgi:hypothetical protein